MKVFNSCVTSLEAKVFRIVESGTKIVPLEALIYERANSTTGALFCFQSVTGNFAAFYLNSNFYGTEF